MLGAHGVFPLRSFTIHREDPPGQYYTKESAARLYGALPYHLANAASEAGHKQYVRCVLARSVLTVH